MQSSEENINLPGLSKQINCFNDGQISDNKKEVGGGISQHFQLEAKA